MEKIDKMLSLLRQKGYSPFFDKTQPLTSRELTAEYALAIEWIRVNFGIWIHTNLMTGDRYFSICTQQKNINQLYISELFNSPQAATEAALLHTLKNLIP